jgi:hypothetical protein
MKNGLEIDERGHKFYYLNDLLHRIDGPAIKYKDGTEEWYQNDKRHRLNGPAVTFASGYKYWYQYGQLHRLDGPAIETPNGGKVWYFHDKNIKCASQEEFEEHIKLAMFW